MQFHLDKTRIDRRAPEMSRPTLVRTYCQAWMRRAVAFYSGDKEAWKAARSETRYGQRLLAPGDGSWISNADTPMLQREVDELPDLGTPLEADDISDIAAYSNVWTGIKHVFDHGAKTIANGDLEWGSSPFDPGYEPEPGRPVYDAKLALKEYFGWLQSDLRCAGMMVGRPNTGLVLQQVNDEYCALGRKGVTSRERQSFLADAERSRGEFSWKAEQRFRRYRGNAPATLEAFGAAIRLEGAALNREAFSSIQTGARNALSEMEDSGSLTDPNTLEATRRSILEAGQAIRAIDYYMAPDLRTCIKRAQSMTDSLGI